MSERWKGSPCPTPHLTDEEAEAPEKGCDLPNVSKPELEGGGLAVRPHNSPVGLWADEKYNPIKGMGPSSRDYRYVPDPAQGKEAARPGAGSSHLSDAA